MLVKSSLKIDGTVLYFLFKKENKMLDQPLLSTDFNLLDLNKNHVDKNLIMEVLLLIFGM